MSLLREIQDAIVDQDAELGPILLKLRLLADRLGSHQLEEWVKYESEGYPTNVEIPEYRQIEMSYTGSFNNIAWQAQNQPIPSYLIEQICGVEWTKYKVKESIAAIDGMLKKIEDGGRLGIDASNLILMLQGKVYEGMNCTSVQATFSEVALREIRNIVRSRILELTMKLEKEVPDAANISIAKATEPDPGIADKVGQVFNTTVYGTNQVVASSGENANVAVNNVAGDAGKLASNLISSGVPEEAAREFSSVIASEKPDGENSFGPKAVEWLSRRLPEIAKGAWGISTTVATKLLEEAAMRYYGIK